MTTDPVPMAMNKGYKTSTETKFYQMKSFYAQL